MFKAEWDCQPIMDEMEEIVQFYDRTSEVCAMSDEEMLDWIDLMEKITAWVNLKDGLDPVDCSAWKEEFSKSATA